METTFSKITNLFCELPISISFERTKQIKEIIKETVAQVFIVAIIFQKRIKSRALVYSGEFSAILNAQYFKIIKLIFGSCLNSFIVLITDPRQDKY